MIWQELKKYKLPDTSGVYFFKRGKKILYIGKATSLKDRVKSYFANDLLQTRGSRIVSMIVEANSITFKQTDSVLEALILEAAEIRKHQPPYNIKEKDDKSFNYVVVTKEDFPRVLVVRGRDLLQKKFDYKIKETFGPFTYGSQLKEAMKIVRKMFPYRDRCIPASENKPNKIRPCFNRQIGLCPGVCTGEISKQDYAKTIRHIVLFFSGNKKRLLSSLKKEMMSYAKARNFEKANEIKKQIFALEHIRDVSLLKNENETTHNQQMPAFRIEAYDIAHISGTNTVGVMTVIENGELKKSDYRKFKIHGASKNSVNDIANLKEVLIRRLGHAEWPLPNLMVVDGSTAQINAAKSVLKERGFNIEIAAVVKDDKHKAKEIIGEKGTIDIWAKSILLVNSEAHRFAIAFHRKLRGRLLR
jgi:excinuclease ABC subunit C